MATFSVASKAPLPAGVYNVALLTDLFSIAALPAGDWDDHCNLALALCTQDQYKIRMICLETVLSGSLVTAKEGIYDAYETSLAIGTLPAVSLTRAQLENITVLATSGSPPAAGYRVVGNSGYERAHNGAQRLIKTARTYGDPTGTFMTNPYGKLWVCIMGGYEVFAQALREAIVDAELPDFLDRCVFFGCPFYNANITENSWAYWCNNHYFTDAVTPGLFGSVKMMSIYPIMDAVFSNTDASQQTQYDLLKVMGVMGPYLDSARAAGSLGGTAEVYRASELATMYYWLKEAARLGSWDPTNASNGAGGAMVLYDGGGEWPYAHGGTGLWANLWPDAETNYSPTHWGAPEATNTLAETIAAWDMTGYRTWLGDNFARYEGSTPEVPGMDFTDGANSGLLAVLDDF